MSSWTVPGYTDVRELGRSAVGRTMVARHAATGAPAVIRYLADGLGGDAAARQRCRDLARALTGRTDPQVAAVYEYVEADRDVALVREYVTGASLRVLLTAHGAMKPEAALTVLKGGLLGLAAAGVVHGAYTPENLLVDVAGRVRVSDVGLAAAVTGRAVTAADDLAAASAHFLACLAGDRTPTPDRVPRRLRGLLPRLTEGSLVVAELEAAARRAYGSDWETSGRERLARLAARHAGRDAGRGRPDR